MIVAIGLKKLKMYLKTSYRIISVFPLMDSSTEREIAP